MKMKRIYAILTIVIIVLATGCGNNVSMVEKNGGETAETGNSDVADKETVAPESSSTEVKDLDSMITEKDDSELDLKAYYYSMEDRSFCNDGEDVFSSVFFESADSLGYITTGKVPIYAQNGVRIGYTNEDVDILVMGTYGDWCSFYLDQDRRYARLSDIEANSITIEERDAMAEEANKQEQDSMKTEPPVENVPDEQFVQDTPVESEHVETPASDKYTPDEAIAVYRSLMESGGITWNPALKDVSRWGTGWIELQKGMPEWCAETNLESFAIGSHGGNSWTQFYFEVTGSDEDSVYITEWHN